MQKFNGATLFCLLLMSSLGTSLDTIKEIWIQTAECNSCGMTKLGHIAAKVCGQSECCFTDTLPGRYNTGSIDFLDGPDIGECDAFEIQNMGENAEFMSVALYHVGTDGGQFDFVDVVTIEGRRYECQMRNEPIDDDQFAQSNNCQRIQ